MLEISVIHIRNVNSIYILVRGLEAKQGKGSLFPSELFEIKSYKQYR